MASLNDLINLANADGGKFFVIDESGDPKLVIMSVDEYQKLLLGKIKREVEDIEEINREILKAQLQEPAIAPSVGPKVRNMPSRDLREEVIDPSFDFEGPKVEIDDL
jgi:hypothetical protein